jgi:hypothetical protein
VVAQSITPLLAWTSQIDTPIIFLWFRWRFISENNFALSVIFATN